MGTKDFCIISLREMYMHIFLIYFIILYLELSLRFFTCLYLVYPDETVFGGCIFYALFNIIIFR